MKPLSTLTLGLLLLAAPLLRADDDVVQQPDGMAPSASVQVQGNVGGAQVDVQASTGGQAPADQAPSGDQVVPQMPTQEQQDYALGVSDYYKVPPERAWDYMDRGITPEELPVVYHLAATAGVSPQYVVSLRVQGLSWQEVAVTLGLTPAAFYWDDVFRVNFGGPFGGIYLGFHRYPRERWDWGRIALSDVDFINLVGLRFTSLYWHRPLGEVWHDRALGRPYFHIGYGYNARFGAPFYAHHEHSWGGGYHAHYQSHVADVRAGRWHPIQAHANGDHRAGHERADAGRNRVPNNAGAGHAQNARSGHDNGYGNGGHNQANGNAPNHGNHNQAPANGGRSGNAAHASHNQPKHSNGSASHGGGHAEPKPEKTHTH